MLCTTEGAIRVESRVENLAGNNPKAVLDLCSHASPEGGCRDLVGRQGATKPRIGLLYL